MPGRSSRCRPSCQRISRISSRPAVDPAGEALLERGVSRPGRQLRVGRRQSAKKRVERGRAAMRAAEPDLGREQLRRARSGRRAAGRARRDSPAAVGARATISSSSVWVGSSIVAPQNAYQVRAARRQLRVHEPVGDGAPRQIARGRAPRGRFLRARGPPGSGPLVEVDQLGDGQAARDRECGRRRGSRCASRREAVVGQHAVVGAHDAYGAVLPDEFEDRHEPSKIGAAWTSLLSSFPPSSNGSDRRRAPRTGRLLVRALEPSATRRRWPAPPGADGRGGGAARSSLEPPFDGIRTFGPRSELAWRGGVARRAGAAGGRGRRSAAGCGHAPRSARRRRSCPPWPRRSIRGSAPLVEEIGRTIEEDGSDVRDSRVAGAAAAAQGGAREPAARRRGAAAARAARAGCASTCRRSSSRSAAGGRCSRSRRAPRRACRGSSTTSRTAGRRCSSSRSRSSSSATGWSEASAAEREEVARILRELSASVGSGPPLSSRSSRRAVRSTWRSRAGSSRGRGAVQPSDRGGGAPGRCTAPVARPGNGCPDRPRPGRFARARDQRAEHGRQDGGAEDARARRAAPPGRSASAGRDARRCRCSTTCSPTSATGSRSR